MKANEILLLGKKLTAEEALQYNMVNAVFPHEKLEFEVFRIAQLISELPFEALLASKQVNFIEFISTDFITADSKSRSQKKTVGSM